MAADRIKKEKSTVSRYQILGGSARIREYCTEQAEMNKDRFGNNQWEAALYFTLSTLNDVDTRFLTTI
jgi:hypothetical protein